MTPEQIDYREKTLERLQASLRHLEAQLTRESNPEIITNVQRQLADIRTHIDFLHRELESGIPGEPIADQIAQKVAQALVREKRYMARRYLNKLETIEPFHPLIDRLRHELEAGRPSRRTRSLAEQPLEKMQPQVYDASAAPAATRGPMAEIEPDPGPGWMAQLFQPHVLLSCAVVLLILCAMAGVGSFLVVEFLFQGI